MGSSPVVVRGLLVGFTMGSMPLGGFLLCFRILVIESHWSSHLLVLSLLKLLLLVCSVVIHLNHKAMNKFSGLINQRVGNVGGDYECGHRRSLALATGVASESGTHLSTMQRYI